ncbi:hypothetical protein RZS08_62265, partial [Arthrospira platensis SPKY1]|nr:hypothetical protein [Arthrospira platensis SPKY1]
AGDYTYQLTDEAGNSVSEVITIVQPAAIEVSVVITNETDGLANGGLEIVVLGGTPPYTYNWSNGAVTQDIFDLAAGDYKVTVTDSNGCTFETVYTVDSRT